MLPIFDEIRRSIVASASIMTGRQNAVAGLNLTTSGFWRSFVALVLALPLTISLTWLDYDVAKLSGILAADTSKGLFVAAHTFASLAAYIVSLVALYGITKTIDAAARYSVAVIALNWGGLCFTALSFPIVVMMKSIDADNVADRSPTSTILALALTAVFAVAMFNIVRLTLNIPAWPAAIVVFVVSVFEIVVFFSVLSVV